MGTTLCQFARDGEAMICRQCGRRVAAKNDAWGPKRYRAWCRSAGPMPPAASPSVAVGSRCEDVVECPHLGEAVGETLLFGCGCGSTKTNGMPVTVSACELHGRCVTFAKGTHLADVTIRRCVECDSNPTTRTTTQ